MNKKVSEEQVVEMRRLKDTGLNYKQIAEQVLLPTATVYYKLNQDRLNAQKREKRTVHGYTQKVPKVVTPSSESKKFVLKVSGIKVTLNIPLHMSTEAEVENDGIIFNIL